MSTKEKNLKETLEEEKTVTSAETEDIEKKDETNVSEENKADTNQNKEKPKNKKSKIILKTLYTIVESIIWIMIIVLSILLVLSITSKKTDVFGYRMYVIMSGSMEPTIHVKQAIITKEVEEPQLGDVIAFGDDNFITVHRVIKVYTEGDDRLYQTKGDGNNTIDKQLVPNSQVKGIVKYIVPFVGEIILFLQNNLIVLFLAIGALVIIIIVRRLI